MKNKNKKPVLENIFTLIEGVEVTLNMNGLYKPVPLYERKGCLYAHVRGWIRAFKAT